MTGVFRGGMLLMSLALVSACSDTPAAPTFDAKNQSEKAESPSEIIEKDVAMLFSISTKIVTSSPKIGAPIELEVSVTANEDVADAVVRITMPELESAKANRNRGGKILRGAIPAVLLEHHHFAKGETYTTRATVTISVAGYYQVSATVNAPQSSLLNSKGVVLENFAGTQRWLFIDNSTAIVTSKFQPELLPDSAIKQPGALLTHSALRENSFPRSSLTEETVGTVRGPGARLTAPGEWTGKTGYYDPYQAAFVPMGGLTFRGRIFNEYEYAYTGSIGGSSDAYADFLSYCPTDPNERADVEIYYGSNVFDLGYLWVDTGIQLRPGDCDYGLEMDLMLDPNIGVTWKTMETAAGAGNTFFGKSRSIVNLRFTGSLGSTPTGAYSQGSNTITLRADSNRLFSPLGHFTIAHEYGHAFHHGALGGLPNPGSINCPSPHTWGDPEDMTCAFVEGFASYFAAVTVGPQIGNLLAAIEGQSFYTSGDGSRIEGAVASFLYDITDPANETHDAVSYPGTYVGNLMSYCTATYYNSGVKIGKVFRASQLTYCMENQIDGSAVALFTSDFPILGYSESVTEPSGWSAADIRTLWRKTLFGL